MASIEKREREARGSRKAQVSYRVKWLLAGTRQQQSITVRDLREAQQVAAAVEKRGHAVRSDVSLAALLGRDDVTTERTTVHHYVEDFLYARAHRRTQTVNNYRRHTALLVEALGDRDVRSLTPADISAAVAGLQAQGYAPSSIAVFLRTWRMALAASWMPGARTARRDSPFAGVKVEAGKHGHTEVGLFLTDDELARVMAAAAQVEVRGCTEFPLVVELLASTGLRRGEACGLTRRSLVHRNGVWWIEVRSQVHSTTANGTVPLKSPSSKRDVPISDSLATRLLALTDNPSGFLVGQALTGSDRIMSPTVIVKRWAALVEILKRDKGFRHANVRIHDMRHTCASRWLEAGVPLLTVSRYLGHASVAITGDLYGHLSSQEAHRIAALPVLAQPARSRRLKAV